MSSDTLDDATLPTPAGWDCVPLDRLVDQERGISYGIVQPGQHAASGVPIVRVNNLRAGGINTADVMRVGDAIEANYKRTRLRGGEILMSLVGTLGECAVVHDELKGWNVARAVAVIPIQTGVDPHWVTICLRSAGVQEMMRAWANTTVQATLNLRDVRRLPILIAPEPDRSNITRAITELDDKIEQNRRTGRKLEELARAVFKAWFVDFEPVKAKAAGATAFPGMPPETFATLPDTLEDSPLGPVPEGWEVKPIGDVVTVRGGGTPSTKEDAYWNDGKHWWVTPKDLSSLQHPVLLSTERQITDAGVAKISSGILPIDTVLLSSRAPVGYLALAKVPTAINQGFIAIECNGPLKPHFVLHWLESVMEEIKGRASGTTFAEISKSAFRPIPVVVPSSALVDAFETLGRPIFDTITHSVAESAKLATLRDYLLPRLLSGKVSAGA